MAKTQKLDFLLSQDGKTLAKVTKIDLTKDIYAERMNKIDVKDRPVRGNPNAKVTVVNYDDLQCPFCSRMHATLMQDILPQYGDRIKIVYKDFPLSMHPWAQHSANDANCLAAENGKAYWEYADYVHANQRTIGSGQDLQKSQAELDRVALDMGKKNGADMGRLQACVKSQSDSILKASMAEGESLGLNATPTMFINGQKLEGAVDAEDVKAILNQQLLAAGIQPPAKRRFLPPLNRRPPISQASVRRDSLACFPCEVCRNNWFNPVSSSTRSRFEIEPQAWTECRGRLIRSDGFLAAVSHRAATPRRTPKASWPW